VNDVHTNAILFRLYREYLEKDGPPDSVHEFVIWASPRVDLVLAEALK
jgi:hypothetical protein